MRRLTCAIAAIALTLYPAFADAWGTTGHHLIVRAAFGWLPTSMPGVFWTHEAEATVESFSTEMDQLKGAGVSFDRDWDPAHYIDANDNGTIAGVVSLGTLPGDMDEYDRALRAAGASPYRMGYLPYAIADGWEVLRKDFAYWRAFDRLAQHASSANARAWFASQRALREDLILHDAGVWSHFVGDGSQPLHVSVHYNDGGIHAPFEGAFVREHVAADAVSKLLGPSHKPAAYERISQPALMRSIGEYLTESNSHVAQLYAIAKRGGFREATPEAIAFATERVADGARELRDLIMLAYDNSLYESVGYPEIKVTDILDGRVQPQPSAFGGD